MITAKYTITHAKYQSGGDDNDGYPNADSYDTPVNRDVYGWYPSSGSSGSQSSQMSSDADYNRRVIDHKVVLVPDPTVFTVRDQITFPGDDIPWFVSEDFRDYATGPFRFTGGGEIVVEKITG